MKRIIQAHPVIAYFVLTYTISWLGALLVVAPSLLRGQPLGQLQGILMFPALLLGPSVCGVALTALLDGRAGVKALFGRMACWRVGGQWWAVALLLPPVVILATLFSMRAVLGPVFTPHVFPYGAAFGLLAGLLEEIGWTGFAFPRMRDQRGPLAASLILGPLWGLWHLPVIDFLGAAWPHGAFWAPFALAFIAAMSAMRVLICWVVTSTGSLLLAQLMHASSTACLATFGPHPIAPAQEALWYAVYAAALWLPAIAIGLRDRATLAQPDQPEAVYRGPVTRARQ